LLLPRPHVHALLLERLHPLGAGLERQQGREMLRRAPPDRDGVLEVALDLLPLGDLDRGDVPAVELLGELGVGDLHRFLAAARRNPPICRRCGSCSRSRVTSRLRLRPVSTMSSTSRICLPRSSVSGSYSIRTSPLEIVAAP